MHHSHVTDIIQAVYRAILWQGEADVAALLPAATNLSEAFGHAGHEEGQTAQQDQEGKDQDQHEGRRKEEVVEGWIEGTIPAEEERVEGGHDQSPVTKCGLRGEGRKEILLALASHL